MAIVSWRSSKWHAVFDAGCPPYIYQIEINLRLDPHGNSWTSHSQRFRYPTPYDTSAALRIVSKGSSWQSCFPHLPCSHAPATRPECRLPSWSAPPKLLAVPLKRKAMNGKECTPRSRFDIFKLRFKVKLQVCVISSVSLVFKFRDVVLFGTSPSPLPRWTPRSNGQSAASRQERLGSYLVSVTEGSPFHGRVLC